MLTDAEILELEQLLKEREVNLLVRGLNDPCAHGKNKNYIFLWEAIKKQRYTAGKLTSGYRGCVLEGSSRSAKTWSGVDIIIWLCTEVETNCDIHIYRDTYAEFKDTLYGDFKKRLDHFQLPNPFHDAQEVKTFKIRQNRITFLGCDKLGKTHGAGSDYVFYNEAIHIPRGTFDQSEMRCRKFWWMDFNPSVTEHWIFNSVITRPDVGHLKTTFKDNPHISPQEKSKILGYEPWEPGTYEIRDNQTLYYNDQPISATNQPPPHPENVEHGTADEFMWTVYGLGLRGAMKGVIFDKVTWIDKFPDMAYTYGLDFGFTTDPTVLTRYAEDEYNIWIEPLSYQPIETPQELSDFMDAIGVERYLPITADSSDKYTGENKGTVEMVLGLRELGWQVTKVSKTKSVIYWLLSMKRKKIHIVRNHLQQHARKEQENYRFKEVNGICINQPIDKFNHMWDSGRYGHISHNSDIELVSEWG